MKITRISVEFVLDEGTAVEDFMARLLSTVPAPVTIEHQPPFQPAAQVEASNAAHSSSTPAPAEGTARRRRQTVAEAVVSAPVVAETNSAPEASSRRRRTVAAVDAGNAPAVPQSAPQGISDVDLTKAASNTADVLVNMGEDGTGIVKLILEEMAVASVADLPQDQRQKFLDECAKEIRLAKEEKEMAP